MSELNVKERDAVRKHVHERKPRVKAYMEAFGSDNYQSAATEASKLFKKPEVQAEIKSLEQQFKDDAQWAYEGMKALVENPKTPVPEKRKIYESILDRAGLGATQKQEIEQNNTYEGLTDEDSYKELLAKAYKKEFGE